MRANHLAFGFVLRSENTRKHRRTKQPEIIEIIGIIFVLSQYCSNPFNIVIIESQIE